MHAVLERLLYWYWFKYKGYSSSLTFSFFIATCEDVGKLKPRANPFEVLDDNISPIRKKEKESRKLVCICAFIIHSIQLLTKRPGPGFSPIVGYRHCGF